MNDTSILKKLGSTCSFTWNLQYALALFGAVLLMFVFSGCVERKLKIRSEPSEARLFVNGEKKGETPYEEQFVFYGGRRIRLVKEGYQTKVESIEVEKPFYEYFPLNFVTEILIPYTFKVQRTYTLRMKQIGPAERKPALKRAKKLKEKAFSKEEMEETD